MRRRKGRWAFKIGFFPSRFDATLLGMMNEKRITVEHGFLLSQKFPEWRKEVCFGVAVTDKNLWGPAGSQRWIGSTLQPSWHWLSDTRPEPIGWDPMIPSHTEWLEMNWNLTRAEKRVGMPRAHRHNIQFLNTHREWQPREWNLSLWPAFAGDYSPTNLRRCIYESNYQDMQRRSLLAADGLFFYQQLNRSHIKQGQVPFEVLAALGASVPHSCLGSFREHYRGLDACNT